MATATVKKIMWPVIRDFGRLRVLVHKPGVRARMREFNPQTCPLLWCQPDKDGKLVWEANIPFLELRWRVHRK